MVVPLSCSPSLLTLRGAYSSFFLPCRLALVDLDWEKLRAVDILAALRSFLPASGAIKRVTVYPSDYGLERMKQEAAEGPTVCAPSLPCAKVSSHASLSQQVQCSDMLQTSQGIYRSATANGGANLAVMEPEEDDADLFDPEDGGPAAADDSVGEDDADNVDADEVDQEALRLYERSKLRWFYAIAECESARTAAHLYAECDGMEFQLSACKFDLRFVPDAQVCRRRRPIAAALLLQASLPDNASSMFAAHDSASNAQHLAGDIASRDACLMRTEL